MTSSSQTYEMTNWKMCFVRARWEENKINFPSGTKSDL